MLHGSKAILILSALGIDLTLFFKLSEILFEQLFLLCQLLLQILVPDKGLIHFLQVEITLFCHVIDAELSRHKCVFIAEELIKLCLQSGDWKWQGRGTGRETGKESGQSFVVQCVLCG